MASPKHVNTQDWRHPAPEDDNLECGDEPAASPSLLPDLVEEEVDSDDKKVPWYMQYTSGLLVCINAAFLGVCTNATADDVSTNSMCQDSEHVFTSLFLVEFIAKMYLLRLAYFNNLSNWLDFILLVFSILDIWILTPILGDESGASQMSKAMVLRLFRLFRVLRILKLLKQRKELLMLIEGLGAAFRSLVWVALLLAIFIYGAALFAVSIFRGVQTNCDFNFSSVPNAMMTMFTVGTLADWTSIVPPVVQQFPWAGPCFMCFVLVTNYAMLNIIIGVITERTQSVHRKYEEKLSHDRDVQRLRVVQSLAAMLFEEGGRTFITRSQLQDIVHNHEVGAKIQELIMEVDLPVGFSVGDLHSMLDRGGRGQVNKTEFVQGMAAIMFSNQFQQNCLMQASLASLRMQMQVMLKDAVEQIRSDLASAAVQAQARAERAVAAPPGGFGTLPPQRFCVGGGGIKAGQAEVRLAEELVKAAVADRPPPSAWRMGAASAPPGDDLQKLVSDFAAASASCSALLQGILESPAVKAAAAAPVPPLRVPQPPVVAAPLPRLRLPQPPASPSILDDGEPGADGQVPSDEGIRTRHIAPRMLSTANSGADAHLRG